MILLTGASGFIGRAVVERLSQESIPFFVCPRDYLALHDGKLFRQMFPEPPKHVIHMASVVPDMRKTFDTEENASITKRMDNMIAEAVTDWACHAIYISGCSLYSKINTINKFEESAAQVNPDDLSSAYLAAKLNGERTFLKTGFATALRVSAPIGRGIPDTTIAGKFIKLAMSNKVLEVWGAGTREQNYVDIGDIADAVFRSLICRPTCLLNISSDQPITMNNLASEIVKILGRGSVNLVDRPDPKDDEIARFSNKKANQLLGWRAKVKLSESIQFSGAQYETS